MKQEPAHEFFGGDRHEPLLVTARVITPAKRHLFSIERNKSVIGYGNAMSVAAEIADHLVRSAKGRFGIDDPVLAKQGSQKGGKVLRFRQAVDGPGARQLVLPVKTTQSRDKLSTEDLTQDCDGKEEGILRTNPPCVVR